MILFIASEVLFFAAFFWAFFDASLFPGEAIQASRAVATGGVWPPEGTVIFDPWHLPLVNTLILLTSGTTVTWAHHALLNNDRKGLQRCQDDFLRLMDKDPENLRLQRLAAERVELAVAGQHAEAL